MTMFDELWCIVGQKICRPINTYTFMHSVTFVVSRKNKEKFYYEGENFIFISFIQV